MILLTFADAVDSLLAYMGGTPAAQNLRDIKQSIGEALLELVNAHTWSYYYKHGRLITNAPYSQGTIQYQAPAGAYPYEVTLTGGTWPSWIIDGYLYVNNVVLRVDQLIDSTHVTLEPPLIPSADLAAGTGYQAYQDSYELPIDFIAQDQALYELCFGPMEYVHPRTWLAAHRYIYNTGSPQMYTIDGDDKYPNRLVVRFAPLPVDNRTIDFIYKRRPRPILWTSMTAGSVSLTSGSWTVTGSGTAFDQTMVGSVIRVSANSSVPTWMPGNNPAVFEAIIQSVQSPSSLTLMPRTPSTVTYTNTGYVISDPIDIETGSMQNAFLRCCEHKFSQHRIMKDKPSAKAQYLDELRRAKEADSRSLAGRAEGDFEWNRQRLKDMPMGPDLPLGIG